MIIPIVLMTVILTVNTVTGMRVIKPDLYPSFVFYTKDIGRAIFLSIHSDFKTYAYLQN